jgi:hypothetical protein
MGLGVLCAAASIPKFISYSVFASGGDTTKNASGVVVWSQIELYIGITAACIPMLRSFFEGALRRIGVSITNSSRGVTRSRTSGWNRANGVSETFEMKATAPKSNREPDSESYQGLVISREREAKTLSWEGKEFNNQILVTTEFKATNGPGSYDQAHRGRNEESFLRD